MTAIASATIPASRFVFMRLLFRPAHLLATIFILLLATAVLAPRISLVILAIRGDAEIWPHLAQYVLPNSSIDTALLLLGVAAVTASIGIGTAWIVTAFQFKGRDMLCWLLPLPLAFPTYIVAYVYVDILDSAGIVQSALRALLGYHQASEYWFPNIRSLPGAVLLMGIVLYPYVYLAARTMFQTQSAAMIEAARTLGASRFMLARHIAIPLARPALAVGLSLALFETLNDIGASEYLGVQTMTLSIFTTWINRSSLPGAAQIACAMLTVIVALMALERYGRRHRRFANSARQSRVLPRIMLKGRSAYLAFTLCILPVILGFFIPLGFLVHDVIERGLLIGYDPELFRHTVTTVMLAAAATVTAILLGLGAAIAVRMLRSRLAGTAMMIAGLGYAVPGTVLALGLLSPLVGIDDAINAVTRTLFGVNVGLVLAGSSAALVIAYTIRFLAITTGSAQAGLARVSTHMDDVARTLGTRPAGVTWRIHLPLTRSALAGAALLVFVDCLKELPATLLLRPLNVETLSTYIYQFATRGNFEEGALAALLIVLAGILPVIHLTRFADIAPSVTPSVSRDS